MITDQHFFNSRFTPLLQKDEWTSRLKREGRGELYRSCKRLSQLVVAFFFLFQNPTLAQTENDTFFEGPTPAHYLKLLEEKPSIRDNDLLNEQIVDLVNVSLADSVITKRTERHHLFVVGWMIRVFGYNWKSINMRKEKYVGTSKGEARVPSDHIQFTEYDLNIDISPRIKKYLDLAWQGREYQLNRNRRMRHKDKTRAPYVAPDSNGDNRPYSLHCELTPPEGYRAMLNEKFFPCQQPGSFAAHPSFGFTKPTVGVFGPFTADCNHSCHPEIHPYEWIWWYDLHPKRDAEKSQSWYIGMFKEGSNRFPRWSKGPREGTISIPFVLETEKGWNTINLEHLVFSKMDTVGLREKFNLPKTVFSLDSDEQQLTIAGYPVTLKTSNPMKRNGILVWFSDVTSDTVNRRISGRLNLCIRAEEVYAGKVSFE